MPLQRWSATRGDNAVLAPRGHLVAGSRAAASPALLLATRPESDLSTWPEASHQTLNKIVPLQILSLLQALRSHVLRSSGLISRWQNYMAWSCAMQKLFNFICILLIASQQMACAWAMARLTIFIGAEICDSNSLPLDVVDMIQPQDSSWPTTLFVGIVMANNPCNSWHLYAASLHYATMTITSIGYGDIIPTRFEEYIVSCGCEMTGGVIWAYFVGSVCTILCNGYPIEAPWQPSRETASRIHSSLKAHVQQKPKLRAHGPAEWAPDSLRHEPAPQK